MLRWIEIPRIWNATMAGEGRLPLASPENHLRSSIVVHSRPAWSEVSESRVNGFGPFEPYDRKGCVVPVDIAAVNDLDDFLEG